MKGYPYTPENETTQLRLSDTGLPMWALLQKTRKQQVVDIRTAIVACLYLYSSMTYEEIADLFDLKPASIYYMVKRHDKLKDNDKKYSKKLDKVWEILEKNDFCKKVT